MRLCERDKRTVYIKAQTGGKSNTGVVKATYSATFTEIRATIQPLSSKLAAEMYGLKVNDMLLLLYDGAETFNLADGICVYAASNVNPDYKVVSKKLWGSHTEYELEKVT